jgi:sarcosine oxidase subunit beta
MTDKGFIQSNIIINAAGPYASYVARMAEVEVPVVPIRRHVALTGVVDFLPRLITIKIYYDSGLVARREGPAISYACADDREKPGFDMSVDWRYFEFISPKIKKRFPVLDKVGIDTKKSWAGLYSVTPDHHPILGKVDQLNGFYLANGFSGHGVMHSSAVGLVLSELIISGRAESVDISSLSLKRFKEGKMLHEYTVL